MVFAAGVKRRPVRVTTLGNPGNPRQMRLADTAVIKKHPVTRLYIISEIISSLIVPDAVPVGTPPRRTLQGFEGKT
jgi:hypothetical protein